MSISQDEVLKRLVTLADQMDEMHTLISDGHPKDAEGFTKPADKDLDDALRTIANASNVLSRLVFKMCDLTE